MINLVNQVQLIGRLGADAEVKTINHGTKVSTFRMATNVRTKLNSGEWKETTQWHTCVVWGKLNNVVEKFGKKGNQLMISGTLQYRDYMDASGLKKYITEIKVNQILLLDAVKTVIATEEEVVEEEDLPF